VLIVDDEEAVRSFADRALRTAGFQTTVASDGPEALDLAAKLGALDLLLTDLLMPGLRGDELARRLRATQPDLKVLYFTGFSEHLFGERRTLWEDEAFLDKPATVNGLLEAVSLLCFNHL
jgi:two-component system cell cycle sensor histidine kinase/response regulator CckA